MCIPGQPVYCYSSTAVHLAVHKKSCFCTQTFRRCSYINLSEFSDWTCRTFPEVLMVERAALRAFLVGVVGRFSQGPLVHIFRFVFPSEKFAGSVVFFFSPSILLFLPFQWPSLDSRPRTPQATPVYAIAYMCSPYPPLSSPPIHVSVVHQQPPQNPPPHA